jgi:acetyl esterase
VAYRQAPEHPYPASLKDAYAAFNDVLSNAEKFQGDKRRVAIAGEGAGANLAGAVCLMALDQRTRMPLHQVLICPMVSLDFGLESYRTNANARPYGTEAIQWFVRNYAPKPANRQSPYFNLMIKRGVDLPPATVIVAELDPLASEGVAYHNHLVAAAVDSQLGLYRGVTADFFGTGAVVAQAKKAVEFTGKRLRKAFTVNRPNP